MYSKMEKYFATYKAKFEMLFDDAQRQVNEHAVRSCFVALHLVFKLTPLAGGVPQGDGEDGRQGGER